MSPERAVEVTLRLLRETREASDDELTARLIAAEMDRDLARRMLVLVPLAFSRAYYDDVPMIKEYAEEYLVIDEATGAETELSLATDPWFCAAAAVAARTNDKSQVLRVAERSSEFQAINNVLAGLPEGAVPNRIGTSPPCTLSGEPRRRPLWKLWGR